jgi:hypothetical protein
MTDNLYLYFNKQLKSTFDIDGPCDSSDQSSVDDTFDGEADFNFSFEKCLTEIRENKKTENTCSRATECDRNTDTLENTEKEKFEKLKDIEDTVKLEMARYQDLKLIKNTDDPLLWWNA